MDPWAPISAVTVGLAAAAFAATATGTGRGEPRDDDRRRRLRAASATVRYAGPVFDLATGLAARFAPGVVARVAARLELLPPSPWRADEYVGDRLVSATAIALAGFGVVAAGFGPRAGLVAGLALLVALPPLLLNTLAAAARAHVTGVRDRLPFALDLMALLLAGSGTLAQAMARTAKANAGRPLGNEFERLLKGIDQLGDPVAMFRALDRRLADDDIRQFTLTSVTAIDRGIPLKEAFRRLAADMKARRVQWMERSSERAKVRIIGPMYVNMVGCLLVVVAPILLHAFAK